MRPRHDLERLGLVLPDDLVVVLVLAARSTRVDLVRYPEKLLVTFGLERGELGLQRFDLLPHLAHEGLHLVARRPAAARLVALGVEGLHLGPEVARFSVELEDPVQRRVEAARDEHVAHLLGVLADALERGHDARAIIRGLPWTTWGSWRSRDPTGIRSSAASPRA